MATNTQSGPSAGQDDEPYHIEKARYFRHTNPGDDSHFAPCIVATTPAGRVHFVDKDGDGVCEHAFLLDHHPDTDAYCPEATVTDSVREQLEDATGGDLESTLRNGGGGE